VLIDLIGQDDIDEVHIFCVFFGPVTHQSTGPFVVPMKQDIEKIFRAIQ
jgi:hypothetical protein